MLLTASSYQPASRRTRMDLPARNRAAESLGLGGTDRPSGQKRFDCGAQVRRGELRGDAPVVLSGSVDTGGWVLFNLTAMQETLTISLPGKTKRLVERAAVESGLTTRVRASRHFSQALAGR